MNSQDPGSTKLLAVAAVLAAVVGLSAAWWMAQPDRSMSQFDRLASEVGCQCGTCPLRPIATCGCGFADGMLGELATLVEEGHEDHEIMATLISRYNESVRIKPSGSGMALTAWAAPILLLTVGAVAVAAILLRWRAGSVADEASADEANAAADVATPDHAEAGAEADRLRAIVDREIGEIES